MASNSFGNIFRITTWGESHGKAIGAVIDGCPAGLLLSEEEINQALFARLGGNSPYTTARAEKDQAQIFSGLFEGKTTGAPISIIIFNEDIDSSKYEPIKEMLRPGHANFTYLGKYGIFDYRGGGRASARETACRVAAGAVAKKLLNHFDIQVKASLNEVGGMSCEAQDPMKLIASIKEAGDSVGGVIEVIATGLPIGLGDPVYEKLEANLAKAMLSLPATKGFEIGSGFGSARMKGSEHNDLFIQESNQICTSTNHAGGTLGGITTAMPLILRVAFKPTSSIQKEQATVNLQGEQTSFRLPEDSRHDPCVAVRAVPVVEAMTALVLADALLMNRTARL